MPADTVNADLKMSSTTNVTISNAATFDNTQTVNAADCVLVMHQDGRITFNDRLGNKVDNKDPKALNKLYERLLREQTTAASFLTKPSAANS